MTEQMKTNPLGTQPIGKLLQQFAVPSIIAMIVSALYNIVDQFFIGRAVGELGNAATNIAFPLSISCIAIALLFGIGGASAFNLSMGKGKKDEAANYIGNAIILLFSCGVVLLLITQLFLTPMLKLFGSPDNVLEYASIYTRITSFGFPFLSVATGSGNIIRADGSPKFSMTCNLVGAIINTILDAIFVFGFNMGMAGAAYATIIGQIVSGLMALNYLRHFKTVELKKENFILKWKYVSKTISLGASPCINQLSMMLVQIIMNKSLTHYGALSAYGASVPLACAGIITKINQFYFSVVIGISQGLQPIISYNYGAKKYGRVKKACLLACAWSLGISVVAFIAFFFFPRQIISIFGNGSDAYFDFAVMYFRVFLFFTFLNFTQPIISNFFTSIGKPKIGVFLSLTRQILFLLPLVIILPTFLGIDGLLYAGPIADGLAGVICILMMFKEFKKKEYHIQNTENLEAA